jgi:hypothetical protein
MALGGGIDVPPDTSGSSGAAVTVSDSVITGNLAAPVRTQPIGPPCPSGPCPFALAGGGGIATWGPLTLDHTVVTDNRVGTATGLSTVASDAEGGGIDARNGPFVIRDSVISDNEVSASGPDARFADGGGLLMEDGVLTMTGTTVEHNDVRLAVAWPDSVETGALAGGAHVSDPASLVRDSVVSHNSVEMTNSVGGAYAFSGGLHSDADFPVDHTTVSDNTVTSATIGASTGEASADSGAGELADISHSVLDGNTVFVSAVDGKAEADGGAAISDGNLTDTIVSGNRLIARSPHGSAGVFGGGILALALDPGLTLRGDTFSGNQGSARGMTGVAQGGAIYTVAISTPPTAPLILISSTITGNVLTRVPGTARAGGGIFATDPVIRRHTVISGNQPGQCTGC